MLASTLKTAEFGRADAGVTEWSVSTLPVPYKAAVEAMERRAAAIAAGDARELVWLLEHPPVYTGGVSARAEDLLDPGRFPVVRTGRGGQYTYHGPGQRVAYVMLDLTRRRRDVHAFVAALEAWIIAALAALDVEAGVRPGRVGVWVERPDLGTPLIASPQELKIAAIGVKIRRWVSFHGISLNVAPDLSHFAGIVPCGLSDFGVTSLADLGKPTSMPAADEALMCAFQEIFGPVTPAAAPALEAQAPAL
jgi:lipoyl(octanoyl) transferase